MIVFPHAKINLGLYVTSKRSDGFHNLETVFYPIFLRDALEIVPATENVFFQTGLAIQGVVSENLVLRAVDLLKKQYPQISQVEIHLHKRIPMGAGLGGGSSNASLTLQLIDRLFDLHISPEQLFMFSLELGSDCPFFLQSAPCFATEKGENLKGLTLDLSEYSILLIHPEISIHTGWAFSQIKPSPSKNNLKKNLSQPIQEWKHTIFNDFELPVFEAHPSLREFKKQLYDAGALYASMTGSGSTIYGIFRKSALPEMNFENATQSMIP